MIGRNKDGQVQVPGYSVCRSYGYEGGHRPHFGELARMSAVLSWRSSSLRWMSLQYRLNRRDLTQLAEQGLEIRVERHSRLNVRNMFITRKAKSGKASPMSFWKCLDPSTEKTNRIRLYSYGGHVPVAGGITYSDGYSRS